MLDNLELSTLLINNNIDETFAQRFFFLPQIEDMLNTSLEGIANEQKKAAMVTLAIHGSYNVLQNWINDPNCMNPAKASALILELAGRVCRRRD